MKGKRNWKVRFVALLNKLLLFFRWITNERELLNYKMQSWYTPKRVAFFTALAVCLILIVMLFIPPYLGVADDGSLYGVMNRAGLTHEEKNPYNNYFVKKYMVGSISSKGSYLENSQNLFINIAKFIDKTITNDLYFDVRFLALIYGILYIPAVYLIVKHACMRMLYFSEAILVAIAALFIFADISYLTYFNSLYPEALWAICLFYVTGWICNFTKNSGSFLSLIMFGIFGVILCTSRQQCGIIGFLLAGFCLKAAFLNKNFIWKGCCILITIVLSVAGVVSLFTLESDFSISSKHHAMTRGVLFQASNPEKALNEFGIDSSYAVLAKTSAYDPYPFVIAGSRQLYDGFYNKYTYFDIALYYFKHPVAFIKMMDIAVKGTINLRRSFCSNYEKSAGMPAMAQSIFWSGWSFFKEKYMPKTIGFLIVLLALAFAFYSRKKRLNSGSNDEKIKQHMLDMILLIAGIGISQAIISIIMSGDAEITQHAFLLGAGIDIIFYFIMVEAIRDLSIFQDGRDAVK